MGRLQLIVAAYDGGWPLHIAERILTSPADSTVNDADAIRIGEVQRLLRETDDNLDHIEAAVGCNNTQSLRSYFKKFTGRHRRVPPAVSRADGARKRAGSGAPARGWRWGP